MIHPFRRHDMALDAVDIMIRLRDGDDCIVRDHDLSTRDGAGLVAMLRSRRHRYVTRRQLSWLDARGLADIGIDTGVRDRKPAEPFWKI